QHHSFECGCGDGYPVPVQQQRGPSEFILRWACAVGDAAQVGREVLDLDGKVHVEILGIMRAGGPLWPVRSYERRKGWAKGRVLPAEINPDQQMPHYPDADAICPTAKNGRATRSNAALQVRSGGQAASSGRRS